MTVPSVSSYALWVREKVAASNGRSGSNQLFDSSIEEPTALLQPLVASLGLSADGYYRSTFPSGNPLVVEALSHRYAVAPERILATAGATSAVHIVCTALLQPGDRLLVERPFFEMLGDIARTVGARIDYLDRDPATGSIDPAALDAAITPATRLVLLTNPNNPTGFAIDRRGRAALAAVAEARQVPVLFDEVYAGFSDEPLPHTLAAHDCDWFVSVGSLSKLYGLYALKCGWIITGAAVHARIAEAYGRLEGGVSRLAHAVAARVLEDPAPFDAHRRRMIDGARPLVADRFRALEAEGLLEGLLPPSGCICFPRLPEGWCDRDFSDFAWRSAGLAVAPGHLFGRPGYLRIGFGRDASHIREGLDRLEAGLHAYREQHQ